MICQEVFLQENTPSNIQVAFKPEIEIILVHPDNALVGFKNHGLALQ